MDLIYIASSNTHWHEPTTMMRTKKTSLEPGSYHFTFEIPPYTLSNGEYKIVFDVAERNVKCYTTKKSQLTFNVLQGEDCFGNVFAEDIPIKSSLIRENWLKEIKTY